MCKKVECEVEEVTLDSLSNLDIKVKRNDGVKPDKVCEDTFMNIKKASDILTDQDKKQDWDDTGSSGDNVMMTLGVALPKWLVSGENSWWVLGFYKKVQKS